MDMGEDQVNACFDLLKHCSSKLGFTNVDFLYTFDNYIWNADEVKIDFPLASKFIPMFVARATTDKCIRTEYLLHGEPLYPECESHLEILNDCIEAFIELETA